MDSSFSTSTLQSLISQQTTHLIQRMETILFQALSPSPTSSTSTPSAPSTASHLETAISSASIHTETDALIAAAEEIMQLTRVMKGIWVAGGLDVLEKPETARGDEGKRTEVGKTEEEMGRWEVVELIQRMKSRVEGELTGGSGVEGQEDADGSADEGGGEGGGGITHIKEENGIGGGEEMVDVKMET